MISQLFVKVRKPSLLTFGHAPEDDSMILSKHAHFGVVGIAVAIVAMAVLALFYYDSLLPAREEGRRLALARAVSALPPGIQASWIAYIDRRLASVIQRRGSMVRVA
ncbi:MAG: hypothetical protein M3Y22_18900, partial [Pseudomonadota bacterium]|nr:hypothetical protein [Pseudomonadota bacterium]